MPDIIETKDNTGYRVLVKMPPGKRCLTSATFKDQAAQKGGTCWYYALNNIRIRIGKDFDAQYPLLKAKLNIVAQTDPITAATHHNTLGELKALRDLEKIISRLRKSITYFELLIMVIDKLIDQNPDLIAAYSQKNIFLTYKQSLPLNLIEELEKQLGKPIDPTDVIALKSAKKFFDHSIDACYLDIMTYLYSKDDLQHTLTLIPPLINFRQAPIIHILTREFKCIKSTWDPRLGFEQLGAHLKKYGCLVVAMRSDIFSLPLDWEEFSEDKIFCQQHGYNLEHLPVDVSALGEGHVITIVGVKQSLHQQAVYFMDPNAASLCGSNKHLYKILFANFIAHLKEAPSFAPILPLKAKTSGWNYVCHVNEEYNASLRMRYQQLITDTALIDVTTQAIEHESILRPKITQAEIYFSFYESQLYFNYKLQFYFVCKGISMLAVAGTVIESAVIAGIFGKAFLMELFLPIIAVNAAFIVTNIAIFAMVAVINYGLEMHALKTEKKAAQANTSPSLKKFSLFPSISELCSQKSIDEKSYMRCANQP